MKLNESDKKILLDMGYPTIELEQIERLRYKFTVYYKNGSKNEIKLQEAREILSNNDFLSGIGRAAFHCTSYRESNKNNHEGVLIKSNLFN